MYNITLTFDIYSPIKIENADHFDIDENGVYFYNSQQKLIHFYNKKFVVGVSKVFS